MTLEEFIPQIDTLDEDLILFQKDALHIASEIMLSNGEVGENGVILIDGDKYYYLIEVFIAREFITDWIKSLGYSPDDKQIAIRLWDYAIADA